MGQNLFAERSVPSDQLPVYHVGVMRTKKQASSGLQTNRPAVVLPDQTDENRFNGICPR